ncbi:hypothetical protein [Alkalilimnicola ehrlichii]|uniref:hypothetical protein n=1 Tax=Alkalilimnicola ehrlichii TaxID=351052 RepID=UPI001C6E9054|nr:hypothetical protein [Alkalilimnicola ehrlichii]
MLENKVVFVKAQFKPVGEEVAVKVPTGEKKKGFLGAKKTLQRQKPDGSKLVGQTARLMVSVFQATWLM